MGIHRFYLDRVKSGLLQIALLALGWIPFFIGWIVLGIWWLLDAYFVYRYVNDYNSSHGDSEMSINVRTTASPESELDYIERLHSLFQKGIITEDEYNQRRAAVIK